MHAANILLHVVQQDITVDVGDNYIKRSFTLQCGSVSLKNGNAVYTNGSKFTKGQKVAIRANTPLFASAETTSVTRRISGTYYLYDGIACKNGRYRITTKPEFCGKAPVGQYVTGYVSWDNFGVIG